VPWGNGTWKRLEVSLTDNAVQVSGLVRDRNALVWIHNKAHQWKALYEKQEIPAVKSAEILLRDIPAGAYEAEWWDTWSGKVVRKEQLSAIAGGLKLTVTDLATDIALRLSPASGQ
jgi:hypothetical protein